MQPDYAGNIAFFMWGFTYLLIQVIPITSFIAWTLLIRIIRRRWLTHFFIGYNVFWVGVALVASIFEYNEILEKLFYAVMFHHLLWLLVLIAIYLQYILFPRLSEHNIDRIALINAFALIGFAGIVLGNPTSDFDNPLFNDDVKEYIYVGIASILSAFLPVLLIANPLTKKRKHKNKFRPNYALVMLIIGIVGGVLLGQFLYDNARLPLCTSLFVFSPIVFNSFKKQYQTTQ